MSWSQSFDFDAQFLSSSNKASFPALTICPDYNVAYKQDKLVKYGLTSSDVRQLKFPGSLSSMAFFDEVTHSLEDIVDNIFIQTTFKDNGTGISRFHFFNEKSGGKPISEAPDTLSVQNIPLNSGNWKTQPFILFGKCYTYKVPDRIKKLKVSFCTI